VDEAPLRVCLERDLELAAVHLSVLDWPGHAGPLVYVPDPLAATEPFALAARLAATLAPRYRVLAIMPRPDCPYLVQVDDLRRALQQFGFLSPAVLVSSGLGAALVLPLAAWYPVLVRAIALIDPREQPPPPSTPAARALADCPPDWPRLKSAVACPLLVLHSRQPDLVARVEAVLASQR
jgi:pimeloyl-ACP methyl ester carboxylesterase